MALDLGTSQVHLAVPDHGVVVREPTVVAFAERSRRPVALGREAHRLWEREVSEVQIVHPMRQGVVADFDALVTLLRGLLARALGRRPWLPVHVVVSCPAELTPVEVRALHDCLRAAGCGRITEVAKPLAAALGAGLTTHDEEAVLVVDMGGGATDVGLFSGGLLTNGRTIPFGGENLDQALVRAVQRESGLRITEVSAEQIKEQVGSVSGWNGTGPVSVTAVEPESAEESRPHDLDAARVPEILAGALQPLINELLWTVEQLPRSLQHELTEGGVVLTGGCALLRGIEELIRSVLRLPVATATDPASCTILGLEAIMRDLPALALGGRSFGAKVS